MFGSSLLLAIKRLAHFARRGDQNKSKHGWVPLVDEQTGRDTTRHEGRGLLGNGDRSAPGARTWRGPADTSRLDRDARPGVFLCPCPWPVVLLP